MGGIGGRGTVGSEILEVFSNFNNSMIKTEQGIFPVSCSTVMYILD